MFLFSKLYFDPKMDYEFLNYNHFNDIDLIDTAVNQLK